MKNLISSHRINKIISETIEEYIDNIESVDDVISNEKSMEIVYNLSWKKALPSLFRNGFSREFSGKGAGNMYGAGIYSTYNLGDTLKNLSEHGSHEYGDTILKIGVQSYDRFFILNKAIAQRVYGKNFHPENQLEILMQDRQDVLNKIKNSRYWSQIINTQTNRTALNVQALLYALTGGFGNQNDGILNDLDIRGFVFHGNRDGDVAVIRDFKNAIPLAYSTDKGKTWKRDLLSQTTVDNIAKDHDPIIFLGKDVNKYISPSSYRFINGWMRVQRKSDRKYNLMDMNRNLLSQDFWFDYLSPMGDNGLALCKYDGEPYKVDSAYIYDMDGEIVGELN